MYFKSVYCKLRIKGGDENRNWNVGVGRIEVLFLIGVFEECVYLVCILGFDFMFIRFFGDYF